MAGLIEVEEARSLVLDAVAALPPEEVPLAAAHRRVLAEDVVSGIAVPGFDNSAMDGFAVRARDTAAASPDKPVELELAGESRAGSPAPVPLAPGQAIAISTGAALPEGADAVVRVEDTRSDDARILVLSEVVPGRDVRRAGDDISSGATILRRGERLGAAAVGVLASVGLTSVRCARRPRAALLCTGDELRPPGEPLPAGGAYNSNAHSLAALLDESGAEVVARELVPDDAGATRAALERTLADADVVVATGGVSVGEHDHVRPALAGLGVEQRFWGVALRPGKPTWFGSRDGSLVFGLPGNPVSAVVTFLLFARPALTALQGADPARDRARAALASDYEKPSGRAHALRATLELADDGWRARPLPRQGSHVLTSMLGADCLALIPTAAQRVRAGERVTVELLRS